jgi:hypothetical protein
MGKIVMKSQEKFSKLFFIFFLLIIPWVVFGQDDLSPFLKDRGTGIPTSMFGTYIDKGEMIIYPFYEYYYNKDAEYKPADLGYDLEEDLLGKYQAHEGLIFLGYGFTEKLALEFEASVITAEQHKATDDTTAMPEVVKESGLGDVESQLRWRWSKETTGRSEFFSYFETVFPFQKNKKLIGTQDWELKFGTGLIKGFRWGTMTFRAAIEYSALENKVELGEYALEYLKRISNFFRFYIGTEGSQDELEFITDLQFHVTSYAFIRVNNAFGVTPKTTDYAPEIGILFHF